MDCVILFRAHDGTIHAIMRDDNIVEFDRDEAIKEAAMHPLLRALPYQIVEIDEL